MKTHSITGMIRHNECDAAGVLKLHHLLDYFQNAAAQHADTLRFGMEDMADAGLIWVLARIKLQIVKQPDLYDNFDLITYPTGVNRLFALRQYHMTVGGESAVRASSQWLMINKSNGRPVNPKKASSLPLPDNPDMEIFFNDIDKITIEDETACGSAVVGMGDVDLNRHLNNAVYGRWILDALGRLSATPVVPSIKDVQINFLRAGLPGDQVSLYGKWDGDGSFTVSGTWANGETAFQAAGTAERIDF